MGCTDLEFEKITDVFSLSLFKIRCKLKFQLLKEEASFLPFPGQLQVITEKQNKAFSLMNSSVW